MGLEEESTVRVRQRAFGFACSAAASVFHLHDEPRLRCPRSVHGLDRVGAREPVEQLEVQVDVAIVVDGKLAVARSRDSVSSW